MERRMEEKTVETEGAGIRLDQGDFGRKEPSVLPITPDLEALVEWLKVGEARTVKAYQGRSGAAKQRSRP